MFAKGNDSRVLDAKHKISEIDIVSFYFGITKLPTRICSPLREDRRPSFGIYTRDGIKVFWKDFGTGDGGSIITLLMRLWHLSYEDTWLRIGKEMTIFGNVEVHKTLTKPKIALIGSDKATIETHERAWEKCDLDYWGSYGISKQWLEYANVHPISHIIFVKEYSKTIVGAEKLAYAYLEFKEGKMTTKVYQPLNKNGFKWFSSHDRSVISLWTKVPQYNDKIVICSSLKDALCLWANTGIPAIAPQGEGYTMSQTAIDSLRNRYQKIYILYDNDEPGIKDGKILAEQTGFNNLILPTFNGGKDISDMYKVLGKEKFLEIIKKLIN